jgi:hypothetical protein
VTPLIAAVTLKVPTLLFAVSAFAVATPEELVVAVFEPVKVAEAPLPGTTVKATVTFGTGLPAESVTVACSAVANAVLICALWLFPAVAVTADGLPGVFVRLKTAGVAPVAEAVTVKRRPCYSP